MRRAPLLVVVPLLLASCAEGRVPLSYELQMGQRLEHRLVLTADITRTLAGRTERQRVEAAFRISQEIVGPATATPTPAPEPAPTPTAVPPAPTLPASPSPTGEPPAIGIPGLPGLGGGGAQGGSPTPVPTTDAAQTPPPTSPSPAAPSSPGPGIGLPGLPFGGGATPGAPVTPAAPVPAVDARIILVPESLEVDGRPVDAGAVQDFTVQLAADGRVVAVGASPSQAEAALEPVGLERLLPRLRPVLPGRAVEPGDGWKSETRFQDDRGRFSVTARSRLAQLGETGGYESALVRTTYRSPVHRRETFANAVADVEGEDIGAQEAWFALDGFLVRSSTDSVGTYDVTFYPAGGEPGLAPVRGSLIVRLHTEMQLVSAG
ncbi:MAG TPA: hypothetical protein VHH92_05335 [Actinomycetota bacterium]|nr:hypothetical protein [Actinomycetota bacterium]